MITHKINYNALSEMAYERIKQLILNNSLKAGEKIIQEKMAKKLGISKIPLIQTLTMLSNEGLVIKIPRKGFCVREFNLEEINDIYTVREVLEILSISVIIRDYPLKVINKIKDFLKDFELYYKERNIKKYYDTDTKFHYFLIKSSNNKLIIDIVDKFNILILCYLKGFVLEIKDSFTQHKELIEAIIARDFKKAEFSLRKHLSKIRSKLI
jgi:DNA-binding GntR family transcriptional regulator